MKKASVMFSTYLLLPILKILVLGFFIFSGVASAQTKSETEHPFLIVTRDQYSILRERSEISPWAEMKASAISDCQNLEFTPDYPKISGRSYSMTHKVSSCALSYILDENNSGTYKDILRDTLLRWNELHESRTAENAWDYVVPGGAAFFNSVLALDIIHDGLAAEELASIEQELETVAEWFRESGGGWQPNQHGVLGIWAFYKGDEADLEEQIKLYKETLLEHFSEDGVPAEGVGYSSSRFEGNNERDAKTHFMDVLEFTKRETFYDEPLLKNFYEWFYGYSDTAFLKHLSFGDTSPFVEGMNADGSAIGRAWKFSELASKYAAWRNNGTLFPGRLLHYLFMEKPLPEPQKPQSRIFYSGGAFFWQADPDANALYGALWNCTKSEYHTHKEVNAIHIAGFGEHILRNSGYAGAGNGSMGYSWSYINSTAEACNTAMIDGVDHDYTHKRGSGISEGFTTGMGLDYASGDSGEALPNGTHIRNFVFVAPEEGAEGYFVLFDELSASRKGKQANIALHPNSDNVSVETDLTEYVSKIAPKVFTQNEVYLKIFLATPPASVEIKEGVLADFYDNSVIGKYLYSSYDLQDDMTKNIVTLLLPYKGDETQAKFTRISGPAYTGAKVEHGNAHIDFALESNGFDKISVGGEAIIAKACFYRMKEGALEYYFARDGTAFMHNLEALAGFESTEAISLFMRGTEGKIAGKGGETTFYYPSIIGVKVDDVEVQGETGDNAVTVTLPEGNHDIELETGEEVTPDGNDDTGVSEDGGKSSDSENQEENESESGCGCKVR